MLTEQVAVKAAVQPNKLVGTSIDEIPELKPYVRTLYALGYLTLEHLIFGTEIAAGQLGEVLKTDIPSLLSSIDIPPTAIPPEELELLDAAECPLGFAIESLTPPDAAPALTLGPPLAEIPEVNLIPQMPPIRNQGDRGTCVAHAALSAFEHFNRKKGNGQDLSEQFCYWSCKQNDGRPSGFGTWLRVALPVLKRDGCCTEVTWPYNPHRKAGDEGQGPPPDEALEEALYHRIEAYNELAPTAVPDLKAELSAGRAVAFSIPAYRSWYSNTWVRYTGDMVLPVPGEVRIGGHAMCLVGYVDAPGKTDLGGGRFLVRNSWGENWGSECPYGKGYGTIPYSFIDRYCLEAYSIS